MAAGLRPAHEAGVLIGSGTDHLGPRQDRRGLELLRRADVLGPMAAIASATSANARILRAPDLGVAAVDGDPLADIGIFAAPDRIIVVIKDSRS